MMRLETRKDFLGGLLMLALGLATALQASRYDFGSLRRMGPGFFPLSLGVILALTGALIMATAKAPVEATERPAPAAPVAPVAPVAPEWRGWFCICAGIAAFVVLGQYGGLIPATFAVVLISALGDRQNTLFVSAALATVMTAACVLIFWWLLQVPLPLFRWG